MDFSPAGASTNPLLFTWEELGYQQQAATDTALLGVENSHRASEGVTRITEGHGTGIGHKDHCNGASEPHTARENDAYCPEMRDSEVVGALPFRIVEDENGIQPNMPQYGVPYDMIQQGMYEDLLSRLQASELEQRNADS